MKKDDILIYLEEELEDITEQNRLLIERIKKMKKSIYLVSLTFFTMQENEHKLFEELDEALSYFNNEKNKIKDSFDNLQSLEIFTDDKFDFYCAESTVFIRLYIEELKL